MITIRKGSERGITKLSWLESKHTFSFGSYYDQEHMNFGALRVINEDNVLPGSGFQPHSHRDMEIISIILEGALEHKDSMGTGSIIRPSEIQLMSAGSGVTHSEFNPSDKDTVHFLQIWIVPREKNLTPSYQQKNFEGNRKSGSLTLLVSPDGRDGSLMIHQDALMYVLDLEKDHMLSYSIMPNRMVWVQVMRGNTDINENMVYEGDGARVVNESAASFKAHGKCELLIFDLPGIS